MKLSKFYLIKLVKKWQQLREHQLLEQVPVSKIQKDSIYKVKGVGKPKTPPYKFTEEKAATI
jgi:hypothetical protein